MHMRTVLKSLLLLLLIIIINIINNNNNNNNFIYPRVIEKLIKTR